MAIRFTARSILASAIGCTLLGAFATLGLSASAGAQGLAAFDSSRPVDYAADRIELQDRDKRVVLSGNVMISQGDLKMQAARTVVAYTNDGGVKIQRIDATGGVTATRGTESARGDVAVYDFNRRVITMVGHVALRRSGDTLNGQRLVIDLASGLSSVDGGGSGRVSGSFSVPKRD